MGCLHGASSSHSHDISPTNCMSRGQLMQHGGKGSVGEAGGGDWSRLPFSTPEILSYRISGVSLSSESEEEEGWFFFDLHRILLSFLPPAGAGAEWQETIKERERMVNNFISLGIREWSDPSKKGTSFKYPPNAEE